MDAKKAKCAKAMESSTDSDQEKEMQGKKKKSLKKVIAKAKPAETKALAEDNDGAEDVLEPSDEE